MKAIKKIIDILLTLFVCVLLVFSLAWFVYTFDVFELPQFVESIFSRKNSDEGIDESEENLLKLIESQSYIGDSFKPVEVTIDRALEILSALPVDNEFFWRVVTETQYKGKARIQTHEIYKKGNKVRVDTSEEGRDYTTIFDGDVTTTINNSTGERSTQRGESDFSYTSIINIAAVEGILSVENSLVRDISVVDTDDGQYLYFEVSKKDIQGTDKYFISIDCGLVMSASSTIMENSYFTQTTTAFDSVSVISDSAFETNYSGEAELLISQ